jgi:hypothetical protein
MLGHALGVLFLTAHFYGTYDNCAERVYDWCTRETLLRGSACFDAAVRACSCQIGPPQGERVISLADICNRGTLRPKTECFQSAVAIAERSCPRGRYLIEPHLSAPVEPFGPDERMQREKMIRSLASRQGRRQT